MKYNLKKNSKTLDSRYISLSLKIGILELIKKKKKGHLGGTFSVLDILISIFNSSKLKLSKRDFKKGTNDKVILSKGHSALALYAVLEYFGISNYFKIKDYNSKNKSLLEHPTLTNETKAISVETGSLGHGLPIASGLAFSNLRKNKKKIICVIGDGELYEGSIWESLLFISNYKLTNLLTIVDRNKLITLGNTEKINKLESLKEKFKSFNFNVIECDGHNFKKLSKIIDNFYILKNNSKPMILVCNTIKGKEIVSWEGKHNIHHGIPSEQEFNLSIFNLKNKIKTLY